MSTQARLYPTDKHKKLFTEAINCRVWHSHVMGASFLLERTTFSMLRCTIRCRAADLVMFEFTND